jgi:carbonic anhydrase
MNHFFRIAMRQLTAPLACSVLLLVAPGAAAAAAAAAFDPIKISGSLASSASPAPRVNDNLSEVDLSAKIAAKLAELRAQQAARASVAKAAANARKAAVPAVVPLGASATLARASVPHAWSYEGENGPANWARLHPDWAACGSGARQSPIDIRDGMKLDLDPIVFDYQSSSFTVVDNGHTIEVALGRGSSITVMNRRYELQQFHFHRPSEERINGKSFEMVIHLVHRDDEGRQAIVALLLERGIAQKTVQTVWNNLPLEKNEIVKPSSALDASDLLPLQRGYYTYMGSISTPPCSEGVLWMVMKQPVQLAPAQMALFSRLYPYNARPVQPSSGRIIKESN